MTPAVNFYACGYCFDLMQCEKTLQQCFKIRYNMVIFEDRVLFGNVLRLVLVRLCIKMGYSSVI